jgi:hypothetical protein
MNVGCAQSYIYPAAVGVAGAPFHDGPARATTDHHQPRKPPTTLRLGCSHCPRPLHNHSPSRRQALSPPTAEPRPEATYHVLQCHDLVLHIL